MAALTLGAACIPTITWAAETARFINAPALGTAPAPKLAAQFELRLVLRDGKGLARQLLDAGVDQKDAAAAARLVAGNLGDSTGGCFARVAVARDTATGAFSLIRVTVMTDSDRTVIERRDGELAVASHATTSKFPKLI